MKRVAILTCLKAAGSVCTGAGCLSALANRSGAFEQYQDEEIQLNAFFHCNGCDSIIETDEGLKEKAERILKIHPDAVHLGVCTLKKDGTRCETIQKLSDIFLDNGITVINGTHNSKSLTDIGKPLSKGQNN